MPNIERTTPVTWVDDQTALSARNLNTLSNAISELQLESDSTKNIISELNKDSINILKIDGSFTADYQLFNLSQIVFPLDKASLATYITSLPEPQKTYLTQLSQVHPLNDWKGTSEELLLYLQKSSYNYVITKNSCIGIVVGFINSQTMTTTNPNAIACIRIADLDLNQFMKKFGEVWGTPSSGEQLTIDLPNNNFTLRDVHGQGIQLVSDLGAINIESKDVSDNNISHIRLAQDGIALTTYNDSKPIIFRGSDLRVDANYTVPNSNSLATKSYVDKNDHPLYLYAFGFTIDDSTGNIGGKLSYQGSFITYHKRGTFSCDSLLDLSEVIGRKTSEVWYDVYQLQMISDDGEVSVLTYNFDDKSGYNETTISYLKKSIDPSSQSSLIGGYDMWYGSQFPQFDNFWCEEHEISIKAFNEI